MVNSPRRLLDHYKSLGPHKAGEDPGPHSSESSTWFSSYNSNKERPPRERLLGAVRSVLLFSKRGLQVLMEFSALARLGAQCFMERQEK